MAVEPTPTWREQEAAAQRRGVLLDPQREPVEGVRAFPSEYAPGHLLISGDVDGRALEEITAAAKDFGWQIEPELVLENRNAGSEDEEGGAARNTELTRAWIRPVPAAVRDEEGRDAAVPPVDAWRLLQQARRRKAGAGLRSPLRRVPAEPLPVDANDPLRRVGLDHVLRVDTIGVNRYARTNPSSVNRYARTNPSAGADSYAAAGTGGLEVVDFVGEAPHPRLTVSELGRRPVVAVLDTGCGYHSWLPETNDPNIPSVRRAVRTPNGAEVIGIDEVQTDPEVTGDLTGPRDGMLDGASGHGTFVTGIVRQLGPDADILPVRVADSDGSVLESELITALEQLATAMVEDAMPLDVLNLSLSYYHETPDDGRFSLRLYEVLAELRGLDVVVVCSAGNDATDRPAFPAALWDWADPALGITESGGLAPLISVGALNPSRRSVALYSNVGNWVRVYAPGTSVLSTIPPFEGGVQAGSRADLYDLPRMTIDPDDFTGGFAIWSGTSFAAPYVAGLIAQEIAVGLTESGERPATAVEDVLARLGAGDAPELIKKRPPEGTPTLKLP